MLEIEFTLKPGKRREFTQSFEELHGHEGEGHVRTRLYEDCEQPGHMIWLADWVNRQAVEEYMRGEPFRVLLGGLRVLSTVTECRLVDEVGTASGPRSGSAGREFQDRLFRRIELPESEPQVH